MSDSNSGEEHKRKPIVYDEGKQAATKFQAAMRAITGVSKDKILKLEKQKWPKSKRR